MSVADGLHDCGALSSEGAPTHTSADTKEEVL
jgi:hypothetical protein